MAYLSSTDQAVLEEYKKAYKAYTASLFTSADTDDNTSAGSGVRVRLEHERCGLEAAITAIATQMAVCTEQLALLQRYPDDDPFTDEDILQFNNCYHVVDGTDEPLLYVAIRHMGMWLVTGTAEAITWADLVELMFNVDEVWHVNARDADGRYCMVKAIG